MDSKEKQDFLENTSVFKEWKTTHEDAYLVHFLWFGTEDVNIGYYEQKADTITTFHCGTEITQTIDTEIFKEEKIIPPLACDKITISLEEAKEIAEKIRKQKYPHDIPTKEIIVLQTLNTTPIYNMSFVTNTCKLITIRIHAETGNIEEERIRPLMDFIETFDTKERKTAVR